MPTVQNFAVFVLGAAILGGVFLAYQTPAMALVMSAIRYCF